jgi:hypothetical protein
MHYTSSRTILRSQSERGKFQVLDFTLIRDLLYEFLLLYSYQKNEKKENCACNARPSESVVFLIAYGKMLNADQTHFWYR